MVQNKEGREKTEDLVEIFEKEEEEEDGEAMPFVICAYKRVWSGGME